MQRPGFLGRPMLEQPPRPGAPSGPSWAGSLAAQVTSVPWRYALMHDRHEDLLIWLTRGQGRALIEGASRGLSVHCALFIPAGTLFSLELFQGTQGLMVQTPAGGFAPLPSEALMLRVRRAQDQAELTGLLDNLLRENAPDDPLRVQAFEAHLNLLAIWLLRSAQTQMAETPHPGARRRLVARYGRALVRDYHSPRKMGDYARALDVTPTHLTRSCRACLGLSAADMLAQRKLHAARLALEKPRPSIADVSKALGFSSQAQFARFVQNHTDRTPSALRASAGQGADKTDR